MIGNVVDSEFRLVYHPKARGLRIAVKNVVNGLQFAPRATEIVERRSLVGFLHGLGSFVSGNPDR